MELKRRLHLHATGMADGTTFFIPHSLTQKLTMRTWEELENVRIQDMWAAACIIQPGYRSFPYSDIVLDVVSLKERGKEMLRRLSSNFRSNETIRSEKQVVNAGTNMDDDDFDVTAAMSFMVYSPL